MKVWRTNLFTSNGTLRSQRWRHQGQWLPVLLESCPLPYEIDRLVEIFNNESSKFITQNNNWPNTGCACGFVDFIPKWSHRKAARNSGALAWTSSVSNDFYFFLFGLRTGFPPVLVIKDVTRLSAFRRRSLGMSHRSGSPSDVTGRMLPPGAGEILRPRSAQPGRNCPIRGTEDRTWNVEILIEMFAFQYMSV